MGWLLDAKTWQKKFLALQLRAVTLSCIGCVTHLAAITVSALMWTPVLLSVYQ